MSVAIQELMKQFRYILYTGSGDGDWACILGKGTGSVHWEWGLGQYTGSGMSLYTGSGTGPE